MSLYGALFSGVSGLTAQSNKLGVISDNISNVNTVGYKATIGVFGTLVTSSATTAAYSPGGVLGSSQQTISAQGLLQTTSSPTDIGIQGSGFFVVNQLPDGSGQVQYTRAGSFTADSTGNFRNSAGLYLQAWPLDRNGLLPGEPGNLNTTSSANLASLETVNVTSLTGSAAATSSVAISANLRSTQTAFLGADGVVTMDSLDSLNAGIASEDVIVPSTVNSTQRGDAFTVTTGQGVSYTYTYGGFTFGRNIITGSNDGDGLLDVLAGQTTISGNTIAVTNNMATDGATGVVTITSTDHDLETGDVITITGATGIGGILTAQLNGTFVITKVNDDSFTITTAGTSTSVVTTGSGAATLAIEPIKTFNATSTVRIRQDSHGLTSGETVTLSGITADLNNIPSSQLNDTFIVTVIDDDHFEVTVTATANATGGGGTGTIISETRPFIGNILDATNANQPFLGTTTTAPFSTAALSFTITTSTTGTLTFTYTSATPNAQTGQFNNLTNLAAAIHNVNGLSARVVDGRLYVSATDSNEAITFANMQSVGDDSTGEVLSGIDWVRELGLRNVVSGSNRFATMEGLADIVNSSPGLGATVSNPIADSSISIYVQDPLDTITFSDRTTASALTALSGNQFTTTSGSNVVQITMPSNITFVKGDVVTIDGSGLAGAVNGIPKAEFSGTFEITKTGNNTFTIVVDTEATSGGAGDATDLVVTPPNNSGSLLGALGLVDSLNNDTYTAPLSTGELGPSYDPTSTTKNMASGSIPPHSTRPATIFDAQGTGHNISMSFLKTAINTWAVEVYAVPATDLTSSLPNGQIAYGTIIFNGDGTLRSVSSGLSSEATIQWTNGASPSEVTFDWGTAGQPAGTANATVIGLADGMSQQSADYSLNFINQNGAPVGQLSGVSIDRSGFITASYSNGETQRLFKIPLASFANPNQMQAVSGNAFTQTSESGEVNLKQADTSGVGFISSSALEASNAELANQLTDMIVAQRAYQANTKVISTADTLLENLNQILR
jgi:flagellar hook protein FlgE